MIPNRRTFQRFNIITVLEFKLLTANEGPFAGITSNFSYEGLCLETQCITFEPGDSLEFRLRHPHSDMTVTFLAYVVWKTTADKFACLMGIKLRETELDTRLRMLEIMSVAGDVPVDSFLSDASDDNGSGETENRIPDLTLLTADKESTEPEETVEEDTGLEAFRVAEQLRSQERLITEKKSVNSFDEVLKQAQAEGPEAEDMMNEEALESDMPWPRANAADEKTAYGTNVLKKLLENRIVIYSSSTVVLLAVLIYALSLIFKSPDISVKTPVPAPAESTYRQESPLNLPVPPVEVARNDKAEEPAIQQPDEKHISKTESSKTLKQEVPAAFQQPPVVKANGEKAQYVQVGAWRNPDNAKEMLQKLNKYYPEAYLTTGTKLNKIKIPVKDKPHGNRIIKDIEDKFHIKPMLTTER